MKVAWTRVRGVAVVLGAAFAACSPKLDLLGEMNHGKGGEAGAAAGAVGAGAVAGVSSGAGGTFVSGGQGGLGGQAGSITQAGEATEGGATDQPEGPTAPNYQYNAMWPTRPIVLATQPGRLSYTKVVIHTRFLAESCTIADYDGDGLPDVSSGRRWYRQQAPAMNDASPTFEEHVFRGGHDDLPRFGDGPELTTGISDDHADYGFDMDRDGDMDIINVAYPDVTDSKNPNPAPAPQPHATAYWYENPGGAPADALWNAHLMHDDVRSEVHGIADLDGDGKPELFGACKTCSPPTTLGYYYASDWKKPAERWQYHAVTRAVGFPYGGLGLLHGGGFGDINGDGAPDLLERAGAWTNVLGPAPVSGQCPGPSCAWLNTPFYDNSETDNRGPSQMYATDLDGDGDADVVAADWAHGEGLAWYEQRAAGTFVRHQFMGSAQEALKYGAFFTQPHALAVADMNGDGVPDIVTGKTHYANPRGSGDPDLEGLPVIYVFRTKRGVPDANGAPLSFEPILIDDQLGVGRQIAIGHLNGDGILDVCVATKLGLAVFLGQ